MSKLTHVGSQYGAPMGRSDSLPEDLAIRVKLSLVRMRMVDGCYDQGGAYWGLAGPQYGWMYRAENEDEAIEIFIRARSREEAKAAIVKRLPNATFYR